MGCGPPARPAGHVDPVLDATAASAAWRRDRPRVHVLDRAADSGDHSRPWEATGHTFRARADADRIVRWDETGVALSAPATRPGLGWQSVGAEDGPAAGTLGGRTGTQWVCEAAVAPDRPGRTRVDGWNRTSS